MQNSKQNIIRARAIMSKLPGFTEESKQAVCLDVSGGRTSHLSQLTINEGRVLIRDLQGQVPATPADRMRRKIIHLALELGWTRDGKIDMAHLDNWCLKYGGFGKKLDDHAPAELPKVVTAMERNHRYVLSKL